MSMHGLEGEKGWAQGQVCLLETAYDMEIARNITTIYQHIQKESGMTIQM